MARFKIFGIGLSKTGISSLWRALNGLGFRISHYPSKVWMETGLPEGWDGAVDTPVCRYFPTLDYLHPGSKFILTWRPLTNWLDSAEAHWERRPSVTLSAWGKVNREALYKEAAFIDQWENNEHWKLKMAGIYGWYHRKVFDYFKNRPDDLLIIRPEWPDNWERLLRFLHPACTWPHENPRSNPLHGDGWRKALVHQHAFDRIPSQPGPETAA